MKLYEIVSEYRIIGELLDASGGELTPEVEARLSALEGEMEGKVDGICSLVREAQAEAEALFDEAERLKARSVAAERRAERLKGWLLASLKAAGRERVKTGRFTVWPAKAGRPSIGWPGEPEAIPAGLSRTRVELDGTAAYAAFKAGTLPDGFAVRFSEFLGMR